MEFPALQQMTFLDAAAVSIIPTRAADDIKAFLEMCLVPQAADASLHHIAMDAARQRAVDQGARLLGTIPNNVALVESTTHGLNIAANALPLADGDKVLIADTEFLQVAIPWAMKKRSPGIEIVPVRSREDGVLTAEDFAHVMDDRTRVVCVSSVQWCSGYRVDLGPLGELCRARGVYLVVDAIQELGACPLQVDRTPVDILMAGGHKWLNAPFGCGLLYLSDEMLARLEPPGYGYLALEEPSGGWGEYFRTPSITPYREWQFQPGAKRFEIGGTSNYPGAIGLGASLQLINEIGIDRIHRHILQLTARLHDGLQDLGARVISGREEAVRSGITVFRYHDTPADERRLLQALLDRRILVAIRFTSNVGGIRVSTHFYNSSEDVDRLLQGLREAVSGSG